MISDKIIKKTSEITHFFAEIIKKIFALSNIVKKNFQTGVPVSLFSVGGINGFVLNFVYMLQSGKKIQIFAEKDK